MGDFVVFFGNTLSIHKNITETNMQFFWLVINCGNEGF